MGDNEHFTVIRQLGSGEFVARIRSSELLNWLNEHIDGHYTWARESARIVVSLPENKALDPGYHGRWENLTLVDCKLLFQMGIDIG